MASPEKRMAMAATRRAHPAMTEANRRIEAVYPYAQRVHMAHIRVAQAKRRAQEQQDDLLALDTAYKEQAQQLADQHAGRQIRRQQEHAERWREYDNHMATHERATADAVRTGQTPPKAPALAPPEPLEAEKCPRPPAVDYTPHPLSAEELALRDYFATVKEHHDAADALIGRPKLPADYTGDKHWPKR